MSAISILFGLLIALLTLLLLHRTRRPNPQVAREIQNVQTNKTTSASRGIMLSPLRRAVPHVANAAPPRLTA
jgi:hypothetical protein